MIAITKVLFERVLTQAEMQQMILNSPQTAQAGQGVHVNSWSNMNSLTSLRRLGVHVAAGTTTPGAT